VSGLNRANIWSRQRRGRLQIERNFPADLRALAMPISARRKESEARGEHGSAALSLWERPIQRRPAQRYLVNNQREAIYLVDPGINGTHRTRPDARR